MTFAIVVAGGVGIRMNSGATPKQFLEIHGKPIIVHTLEVFQRSSHVDGVSISCHADYLDYMKSLCTRYDLTKVKCVVAGGRSRQESVYHGLLGLKEIAKAEDVVIVHDGVRPNIDHQLLGNLVASVMEKGSGIASTPATETHAEVDENGKIVNVTERSRAVIAKAPQCFRFGDLFQVHAHAHSLDKHDFVDCASMMRSYGYELHTVPCRWDNIKITTPSDFYIFRAILEARENSQIFGL